MKKELDINEIKNKYHIINYLYNFNIEGKPIQYLRERKGGNHFYNPRAALMVKTRNDLLASLNEDTIKNLKQFTENEDTEYYVILNLEYYVETPKAMSKENKLLAEHKIIRPGKRPDLDNYDKFIIDMLHNVLYDDDKRVVTIRSEKYYSEHPRTEIRATIQEIKKKS